MFLFADGVDGGLKFLIVLGLGGLDRNLELLRHGFSNGVVIFLVGGTSSSSRETCSKDKRIVLGSFERGIWVLVFENRVGVVSRRRHFGESCEETRVFEVW